MGQFATWKSLPVSTTHLIVGAMIGFGITRGIEAFNFRIMLQIAPYWVLTVPAAALTSEALFTLFKWVL